MTTTLHRVDPPSPFVRDGRVVIGAGAPAHRFGRAAGFSNTQDDGWATPRWAQADNCSGGRKPTITKRLRNGTTVPIE